MAQSIHVPLNVSATAIIRFSEEIMALTRLQGQLIGFLRVVMLLGIGRYSRCYYYRDFDRWERGCHETGANWGLTVRTTV